MPPADTISLKQLRALRALAQHGTISAAAESLRLTPPAVHTQLRTLATNLRTEIVRRGPSGAMQLTEAGELLLAAANRIEGELAEALRDVDALRKGLAGTVTLAVVSTGKYFAPRLVALLKRAHPDIRVILKVGNRDQTLTALAGNAVQLAIMGRPPRIPPVVAEVLGPHPHVMIAPPDHPLAGKHASAEELLSETFIAREEGSGTRILMTRFLDRIGEGRVYETMELGSNETIKQAVMAGLGIALISRHTVTEELHSGRLTEIHADGLPIQRQWFLLHRADAALTPAAERIKERIMDLRGSYLPN